MENTNVLLDEELLQEFDDLKTLTPGSEEHVRAVDALSKLYKLKQDDIKSADETELKKEQQESEKRSRNIKNGIELLGVVLPLAFYNIWMDKGFKFESDGYGFTSVTFRGLINKFKPTKR